MPRSPGTTERDARIEAVARDVRALREMFDRVIADLDDRVRRLEDPAVSGIPHRAGDER